MYSAPPTKRYKDDGPSGRQNGDHHRSGPPHDRIHTEPSIVVHVRQLSPKATEADILEALQSFGRISYVALFRNKAMALVEFESLQSSQKCVQFAQGNAIYVCGQPALFNFSTSKSIQRQGLESGEPNRVLVLTIQNAVYPINVETIHTITKPHGDVQRIAILRRFGLQALVEFAQVDQAVSAKHALNGADIYSGCCTLKVEFAKADRVRIERMSEDQWDFTQPPEAIQQQQQMNAGPRPEPRKSLLGGPTPDQQLGGAMPGGGPPQVGAMGGMPPQPGMVSPNQGRMGYGGGPVMDGYGGVPAPAGPNFGYGQGGGDQGGYGGGGGRFNRGGGGPRGGMMGGPGAGPGFGGRGMGMGGPSGDAGAVAMLYGIDHEHWNCNRIFNILCLYGNVFRIKMMKTKQDTAMIEFGNAEQMHQAINNLTGLEVFDDAKLTLRTSKQTEVKDTGGGFPLPDGTPSFMNYDNDRRNRFLTQEAAAKNRVIRPVERLHWYNAPVNITEDGMKEIFAEHDAPIPSKVTIFEGRADAKSSTGVLDFENIQQALEALVKVNHIELPSPGGRSPYIFKLAFAGSRSGGPVRERYEK